ncbi:MAG: hypothetical protein IIT47_01730 [Oscillospiraceae bacterium]|nr:hypothetical protein [Oscillospiraceae bacterium]
MDGQTKRQRYDAAVERLLEAPYSVVDFLPRQVPANGGGQFFAVEAFFLQPEQLQELYRRFAQVLLKLNCYYDLAVGGEEENWIENPAPQALVDRVLHCAGSGYLTFLLPSEDAMITLSGGDLCMTVYHPSPSLLETVTPLAQAEGLFVWQPPQKEE